MRPSGDAEIGRLISTRVSILAMVGQARVTLDKSFPATLQQLEELSTTFERELGDNLLRIYGTLGT